MNPLNFYIVNPSFKSLKDYGCKDPNMVYVPILFEENEDTFNSSLKETSSDNKLSEYPKNGKVSKIIKGGGITAGVISFAPDAVKSAIDNVSRVIDEVATFTTDTMDKVSEVKSHYNNVFNPTQNKDLIDKQNITIEKNEATISQELLAVSGFTVNTDGENNLSENSEDNELEDKNNDDF